MANKLKYEIDLEDFNPAQYLIYRDSKFGAEIEKFCSKNFQRENYEIHFDTVYFPGNDELNYSKLEEISKISFRNESDYQLFYLTYC